MLQEHPGVWEHDNCAVRRVSPNNRPGARIGYTIPCRHSCTDMCSQANMCVFHIIDMLWRQGRDRVPLTMLLVRVPCRTSREPKHLTQDVHYINLDAPVL